MNSLSPTIESPLASCAISYSPISAKTADGICDRSTDIFTSSSVSGSVRPNNVTTLSGSPSSSTCIIPPTIDIAKSKSAARISAKYLSSALSMVATLAVCIRSLASLRSLAPVILAFISVVKPIPFA